MVKTEAERRGGHAQVKTYSVDELVTIWKYATPRVRAMTALALNCAFGGGEIATLLTDEVMLDMSHPHAEQLGLSSEEEFGSWILRIGARPTCTGNGVYGRSRCRRSVGAGPEGRQ